MSVIQTRRFGELEYDSSKVLQFPAGLPGFDGHNFFAVVEKPELSPIVFLQSLNSPELCFMAAPVAAIDPDYPLTLSSDDRERLALDPAEPTVTQAGVISLALLSAPQNGQLTANLLAPVVINLNNRLAVQAVRTDRRYSHQHPIGSRAEEGGGAC